MKKLSILNFILLVLIAGYLKYDYFFNTPDETTDFKEINVERINIVEKDGKLKMILTNKERQPTGLTIDGETYDYGRGKAGGILMYNDLGEEIGGYLFSGDENGHGFNLTFDQFKNDQVLTLRSSEVMRNGKKQKLYGLAMWERPDSVTTKQILLEDKRIEKIESEEERQKEYDRLEKEGLYGANTFFAGRLWDGSNGLFLMDSKGNNKIRIFVSPEGKAVMEYVDSLGVKRNLLK